MAALEDAFPGSHLEIDATPIGLFIVLLHQHELLRPLGGAELSDGPLRYLFLMVLNEPETMGLSHGSGRQEAG